MTHPPRRSAGPAALRGPRPRRGGRGLAALALTALTALGLVGLGAARTIDARPQQGRARVTVAVEVTPSPGAVAAPHLRTHTSVTEVVGRLRPAARDHVAQRVTASVDRWIDAAYLGSYPRRDFSTAWSSFTPGAARMATHDASLTSNASLGTTLRSVHATARVLTLQILAVRGAPVGITAHLRLGLDLVDSTATRRHDVVSGSLYLSYDKATSTSAPGSAGWHIFGYDIARGATS